jgi:hypothetical protein
MHGVVVKALGVLYALAVANVDAVEAQAITRDNYIDFLPPRPRIVAGTRATATLRLYGDPRDSAYRDADPVDGIDDARARRLLALGELFSPLLRRNNFIVPWDLDAILGPRHLLHVDSWVGNRRIASDSLVLGRATSETDARDDLLLALLREFHPRASRAAFTRPEGEVDKTLFFDMPGHDSRSWRAAFDRSAARKRSRILMHPFAREDTAPNHSAMGSRDARYQLVLQFWFFYPFNDAVNAHEGDWEHINVLVTTREVAARVPPPTARGALQTASELARMLDERYPAADSLVIAAVEYYFHDSVVVLDYLLLGASPGRRNRSVSDPRHVWEDLDFVGNAVRTRLTYAGGRLATHPIVYIGGNNKGPDELLTLRPRFHGSFKRNSGGSYPLPGVWQTVGPMGVTEKVYGGIVPRVRRDSAREWHSLIDDEYFVHYTAADISLVPDWEQLEELVFARADVRRRWSWLLLPVYWGFPATSSLGSGLIKHVDLGQVAVLSPPYHSTWNHVGESYRHRLYEPRVLRTPVSPTTPWAMLQSGWGILNVPLAAWGLMPGYNVALIQLMPWTAGAMQILGAPPGRTYVQGQLPRRFTTAGQGIFVEFGGRDFAGILPRRDAVVQDFVASNPGAAIDETTVYRRSVAGPRLWFNLYFRERFSLENTFSWGRGDVGVDVRQSDGRSLASLRGTLSMRQLTGGIRYDVAAVADQTLRLYARGGYGWLWYEGRGFRLGGPTADAALQNPTAQGGYLPPLLPARRWWPNTWYGGGGAEVFSPRRYWLLHRLGYGMRAEFTESFNKLTFDADRSGRGDVTARRGDFAFSLVFGW